MSIYARAITELEIKLDTFDHNAPIHESEGNAEQAAWCRASAESARAAIEALKAAH